MKTRESVSTVVEFGTARQVFESPRSEITAAYLRSERGVDVTTCHPRRAPA